MVALQVLLTTRHALLHSLYTKIVPDPMSLILLSPVLFSSLFVSVCRLVMRWSYKIQKNISKKLVIAQKKTHTSFAQRLRTALFIFDEKIPCQLVVGLEQKEKN